MEASQYQSNKRWGKISRFVFKLLNGGRAQGSKKLQLQKN